MATRQIREQQESLAQAILDLESMQRLSAKRVRILQRRRSCYFFCGLKTFLNRSNTDG